MSKFLVDKYQTIEPYTPGEQPKKGSLIKLNTNESPFAPSPKAVEAIAQASKDLNLYSDPEAKKLVDAIADYYGVSPKNVIATNGSDETLAFCFQAFCDESTPAAHPDITYGFYKVFAAINNLPSKVIPLEEDFSIDIDKYIEADGTVFIANPNAPTGILLPLSEIERLVRSKPERIVVIDEAYIDFGGESAVSLTKKYNNLLVTGTFSKSRSMAGARLGFGIACPEIIEDLTRIRYSTNPYNVNRMTMAAGIGALTDEKYFLDNCKRIIENREWTEKALSSLGFTFTDSKANFIFAKSDKIDGKELYLRLKENGVLVRHFDAPRISDYNRITIGNAEEMQILVDKIKEILNK